MPAHKQAYLSEVPSSYTGLIHLLEVLPVYWFYVLKRIHVLYKHLLNVKGKHPRESSGFVPSSGEDTGDEGMKSWQRNHVTIMRKVTHLPLLAGTSLQVVYGTATFSSLKSWRVSQSYRKLKVNGDPLKRWKLWAYEFLRILPRILSCCMTTLQISRRSQMMYS